MPAGTEHTFRRASHGEKEIPHHAASLPPSPVEQLVFTLDPAVDVTRLAACCRWLPQQHAALRTGRQLRPDSGVDTFARDECELDVSWQDWRDEPAFEEKLEQFLVAERMAGFDPQVPPLVRFTFLRERDEQWRMVLSMSANLLDWRSLSIVLRQLFHAAMGPASGNVLPVATGANSHESIVRFSPRTDRTFWEDYLDGFSQPTRIDLVADRSAAPDDGRVYCVEQSAGIEASESIRRLQKAAGVTLNHVAQAAWALLLSRYTGTDDVIFGVMRSCRHALAPGLDEAIGYFENTLPLRVDANGGRNTFELLWQVRDQLRRLKDHSCADPAEVRECASIEAGTELYDSVLEFDLRDPARAMGELFEDGGPSAFLHYALPSRGLHLQVFAEEEIVLRLKFRPEQVSGEAAERMLAQYLRCLVEMAREPWQKVAEIDFLTEAERAPIRWPGPQRQQASGNAHTLHDAFADRVSRNPDAIAVVCDDVSLTYAELDAASSRIASTLRDKGADRGRLVGLCIDRSVEQVVGLLGILKSGAGYLPLDPAYPDERLQFLIDDSGIELAVTDSDTQGRLASTVTCVDVAEGSRDKPATRPSPGSHPEDIAYVIYTSGSTGKPKGVKVTHANVMRLFDACRSWLQPGIADVWTLFHSFAFDFSVWEIWGALLHGGRLEVVPRDVARSPEAFHELVRERGVTVLSQTPSAFHQFMRVDAEQGDALPALRFVIFGGEKLDLRSLRSWFERHGDQSPRLVNMYGITETTVHVTYRPVTLRDAEEANESLIGWPLPDLYVRLLDSNGRTVPRGVRGEICVGGAGVTAGYLNRPELNAQRFVSDPLGDDPDRKMYRSGDFARQMPDGELCYLGRDDDQVKIRGFRIDLGEIANTARELPDVDDAVVIVRAANGGSRRLVLYYIATSGSTITPDDVRSQLATRIPEHMVPAIAVPLDEIPVNVNNKIDFKSLPDPADVASEPDAPGEQPEGKIEETLARLYAEVLERARVGRHDDFFGMGGDSVLALHLVSRARAEGITLSPRDVFTHPALHELATVARDAGNYNNKEIKVNREGPLAIAPIQHWFLEQPLVNPDHFNHAHLFRVAPGIDVDKLEAACLHVVRRHDALRMRYTRNQSGRWEAHYVEPEEALEFSRIELDHLAEEELKEAIALITEDIQRSLSISNGLVMRVAHFTGSPGNGDRVMIAIHQLAADIASWGIILQDIDATYRALEAGETLPDGADSSAFAAWAGELSKLADTPAIAAEQAYWDRVAQPLRGEMPDRTQSGGREADARTWQTSLDSPNTTALLGDIHRAYGTDVIELLLAGLGRALDRVKPEDPLTRVVVEHLGRDAIVPGCDISRSVGWFNVRQPLQLETTCGNTGRMICSVKTKLRSAPNKGMGWGLLHYLKARHAIRFDESTAVLFRYIGRFDRMLSTGLLQHVSSGPGPTHAPENPLLQPLEITVSVRDDRMQLAFRYDSTRLDRDYISELGAAWVEALGEIVAHCRSRKDISRTPVDFPHARLDQDELNAFPLPLADAEDILPLSPMQRLYHAFAGTDRDAGFDQWVFRLHGRIDEAAFEKAWQDIIARHDALRTVFVDEGLREPHQVVLRHVPFRLQRVDWRLLDDAAQEERLAEFLAADRKQGFQLDVAPLTRVTLIRSGERDWIMTWSHHKSQVDGWSWPIIAEELAELHDARLAMQEPALKPAGSYRNYIAWLTERDRDDYARFWRAHLGEKPARTLVTRARRHDDGSAAPREILHTQETLSAKQVAAVTQLARKLRLTPSVVFEGAWALLLAGLTGRFKVTMGVAFSGRTAGIPVDEHTIGPFVNNLPLTIPLEAESRADRWLVSLRGVQADVNHYQNVSPLELHEWTGVPVHQRFFDSLMVFQNYATGSATSHWGEHIQVNRFAPNAITNYPLTIAITPGREYRLDFFHERAALDRMQARALARDFTRLLATLTASPDVRISTILKRFSALPGDTGMSEGHQRREGDTAVRPSNGDGRASVTHAATDNETENVVQRICCEVLGVESLDARRSFFDAGAQSISLVEIHERLQKALDRAFPIVKLFQHPTVNAISQYLDEQEQSGASPAVRERSARRRAALQRRQARQPGRVDKQP